MTQEATHLLEKIKAVAKTSTIPKDLLALLAYISFRQYISEETIFEKTLEKAKGNHVMGQLKELERRAFVVRLPGDKKQGQRVETTKQFLQLFKLPYEPNQIRLALREKLLEFATKNIG